jgi:PAS domain S-box-containing protein
MQGYNLVGDGGGGLAESMNTRKRSSAAAKLNSRGAKAQLELKDRALAASAEGITIADAGQPDNPLIYANQGFERLTGYSADEVIGRNCRFLQGAGTDPATLDILRNAIRQKRSVTVQLLNYRKDGTPFWNRLAITPVRDAAGQVTHFIGVQSDVTAEKQATDALVKANAELEAAGRAMKRDLEAAEEVQRSLLPVSMPHVPGMKFAFEFRPCTDVGGDCLNVLPLDDRHLAFYILDVSGHGVAAALLSVTLSHMLSSTPERSFLYQACPDDAKRYCITTPAEVVARLNRHFTGKPGASRYFTMIYGILDKATAEFRYVSAGHLGPIHISREREFRIQDAGGLPAGLMAAATYQESSVTLSEGDRLYLCTDGILEAENKDEQAYGLDRLLDILRRNHRAPLEQCLTSVMQSIEEWSDPAGPSDDASMLVIERLR